MDFAIIDLLDDDLSVAWLMKYSIHQAGSVLIASNHKARHAFSAPIGAVAYLSIGVSSARAVTISTAARSLKAVS
jgi:hypothetical protein